VAFALTILGVNILTLTYDQLEGHLQILAAAGTTYAVKQGYISTAEAAFIAAALVGWVHQFLKSNSTGLVTRLAQFAAWLGGKLNPAKTLSLLVPLCLCVLAFSQHGCAAVESSVAPVGPVTLTGNSTTQGTTANGDLIVIIDQVPVDLDKVAAQASGDAHDTLALGVPLAVSNDPSLLPDFEAAQEGLNAFVVQGKTDPAQLEVLADKGVSPANQTKINTYINEGIAAWTLFVNKYGQYLTNSKEAQYAGEFLTASNQGLIAGITTPATTSPAPATAPIPATSVLPVAPAATN
jgi:hypothetical protein